MNINLKENGALILFIIQFLIVAPFMFYIEVVMDDYRRFKTATREQLLHCVTYERLDSRLEPMWLMLVEEKKN